MPLIDSNDVSAIPAFTGQPAEVNLTNIVSGTAEGEIRMGLAVTYGAAAKHYTLPSASDAIAGFACLPLGGIERSTSYGQDANGNYVYEDDTSMSVLDFGILAVPTEGSPAWGDPVYVRTAADGGNTLVGGCAPAAGTGLELLAGARYEGAASSGVAKIRVRLV